MHTAPIDNHSKTVMLSGICQTNIVKDIKITRHSAVIMPTKTENGLCFSAGKKILIAIDAISVIIQMNIVFPTSARLSPFIALIANTGTPITDSAKAYGANRYKYNRHGLNLWR